ncbi:uncharacterized protein LOC120355985 isoform X1 [Nilaparvata lugens]|uniref:uncharacterized protein LOC120355985 isoform X1 n=1 Tax=Nilaparvata lugens TaxID=108931 RepID=UPI00193EBC4F|nr:uncharacterized protein LOC120355985 isoform X1 [Nilaparvata lugens]
MFSDHMPIVLKVFSDKLEFNENLLPLLPKLTWGKLDDSGYAERLAGESCKIDFLPGNIDAANNLLTKLIADSASGSISQRGNKIDVRKNVWFDRECVRYRDRVFALLKLFRRTNSKQVKNDYTSKLKEYKWLCKRKKEAYWAEIKEKLKTVRDSKKFWELARFFREGKLTRSGNISPEQWIQHFRQLYTPVRSSGQISWVEPLVIDDLLDKPIEVTEIDSALKKARNNKASGVDRITAEFFKKAPIEFRQLLCMFFNRIFRFLDVPMSFTKSIIFPLYKKNDPNNPENYRAISFTNAIYKIFLSVLLTRLEKWIYGREVISENQAGFRKGYSAIDNIYILFNVIKHSLSKRKRLYCFFVDYKAAFDSVETSTLL